MTLTERFLARGQHFAEDRLGLRVVFLVLQHAGELVERVLRFLVLAAECLLASGQHFAFDLDRAIEMAARALELGEILQCLQRPPVRRAETRDLGVVHLAKPFFGIVEVRHRAIGLAEIRGRVEHRVGRRAFECAKPRQRRFEHARRVLGVPAAQLEACARGFERECFDRIRAMCGRNVGRERRIGLVRLVVVRVFDVVVGERAPELQCVFAARAARCGDELQRARQLAPRFGVIADAGVGAAERRADRGFLGRTAGKTFADRFARTIEHLAHAQIRLAVLVRIRRREQIVVDEIVDRARRCGLALGAVVKHRRDRTGQRKYAAQRDQPATTRVPARDLLALARRKRRGRALVGALACARGERAQPPRELARIAEATRGIEIRRRRDVFAQQLIVDVAFPAGRDRAAEITDQQLIEHHAERVDVGAHGRRAAGDQLGREIEQGAAGRVAVGAVLGHAEPRDAERSEPFRFERAAAAEIGEAHCGIIDRLRRDQHVRRLQILVQHADRMRGRERIGDARDQLDAHRARNRHDAAARFAPFDEIAAGDVLGFDEIRRLLDVPVEDAHDRGVFAEAVAQQSIQRDLALERLQRRAVAGELEHAPLVRLVVLDQPDAAETAARRARARDASAAAPAAHRRRAAAARATRRSPRASTATRSSDSRSRAACGSSAARRRRARRAASSRIWRARLR